MKIKANTTVWCPECGHQLTFQTANSAMTGFVKCPTTHCPLYGKYFKFEPAILEEVEPASEKMMLVVANDKVEHLLFQGTDGYYYTRRDAKTKGRANSVGWDLANCDICTSRELVFVDELDGMKRALDAIWSTICIAKPRYTDEILRIIHEAKEGTYPKEKDTR